MHVVDEPEWVIDAGGAGGFRVVCDCGWSRGGFDTASLARSAAAEHQVRPAVAPAPRGPAGDRRPRKAEGRWRWWRR